MNVNTKINYGNIDEDIPHYDNTVYKKDETGVRHFSNDVFHGHVVYDIKNNIYNVKVEFADQFKNKGMVGKYWAANSFDRRYTCSGSGLPFATPVQAYENTPCEGSFDINKTGIVYIKLLRPNSYYINQCNKLLPPHVHLNVNGSPRIHTIILGDNLPNRSLVSLPNKPDRSYP